MLPLMIVLASKLLGDVPLPHIELGHSWLPPESFSWTEDNLPPDVALINGTVNVSSNIEGIFLVCNASYPVQWEFTSENKYLGKGKRLVFSHMIRNSRSSGDIFNKATFHFMSELRLASYGGSFELSGNYTCRSCDDASVSSSVYVFWEGNSPPYLLNAGDTTTIILPTDVRQPSHVNDLIEVVIPCRVSVPSVQVQLLKERNNTWIPLPATEFPMYDPRIGFTITTYREGILGRYQCLVEDSPVDDSRTIEVKEEIVSNNSDDPFREFIVGNASFTFLEGENEFKCCSNSSTPPAMHIAFCEHPTVCGSIKRNMERPMKMNNAKRHVGSSCMHTHITFQSSGVIHCIGSGVSVFREYFFPISVGVAGFFYTNPGTFTRDLKVRGSPYYHWEEAEPRKMISITSSVPDCNVFVGETVELECRPSHFYFARGSKWMLTWKNNSQIVTDGEEMAAIFFAKRVFHPGYITMDLVMDLNLTQVTCFAPVWNSTDWVTKGITFNVSMPEAPTVDNSAVNLTIPLSWRMNDTNKTLVCSGQGRPQPDIVWYHNGLILRGAHSNETTSTVRIDTVNFTWEGDLVCKVTNLAGSVTKTFRINVQAELASVSLFLGMVFLVAALVTTVIIVALLGKRLRDQATSINNLRSVAFKDVLDHQHGFPFANGNSDGRGLDPPPTIPEVTMPETMNGTHGIDKNNLLEEPIYEKCETPPHDVLHGFSLNHHNKHITYHKF